jgi:N-acetyl-alpha-D-muramate 1-phosphate uridylyltransferase
MPDSLAGIVLAAGGGTRLSPLTRLRPKALCPVGGIALVDRAIHAVGRVAPDTAVNVHHGREQLEDHLAGRVHVSVEDLLLGTAGALGRLRPWLDGRDAIVVNADLVTDAAFGSAVASWDRGRVRLLAAGSATLDPAMRLCGALMPWAAIRALDDTPSGLYRTSWQPAAASGELEVVDLGAVAWFDCGTARSYLAANLWVSGGASVIGAGATVDGTVERSVLWPDTTVAAGQRLVSAIRATDRVTVLVR